MNFKIGTTVYINGSSLGKTKYLIIDPQSQRVVYLVIEQSNQDGLKLLPVDIIDIQTPRAIVVPNKVQWDDLQNFSKDYYEPLNGDSNILLPKPHLHPLYYFNHPTVQHNTDTTTHQLNEINNIHTGEKVYDKEGQYIGTVISLGADANEEMSHLVIEPVDDPLNPIHIPARWVSHIRQNHVYLKVRQDLLVK